MDCFRAAVILVAATHNASIALAQTMGCRLHFAASCTAQLCNLQRLTFCRNYGDGIGLARVAPFVVVDHAVTMKRHFLFCRVQSRRYNLRSQLSILLTDFGLHLFLHLPFHSQHLLP